MPTMSEMIRKVEVDNVEFKWGAKRGRGGTKKNVQFYESFTYDGLRYSLYDSVYLFKDGEADPYIGKLIKIWELANKSKKVKVLWFFRPSEICNYLGGLQTLKNELFLGTGVGTEGSGLENINPLEAIAGKCNVVCISKDERNRQPSLEELNVADYIFYRTFDVDKFIISDKLGEYISKVEVRLLLNNDDSQISNLLRIESSNKGLSDNFVPTAEKGMVLQKNDISKTLGPVSNSGAVPMKQEPGAKHTLDTRKHSPVADSKLVEVEVQKNSTTSPRKASSTDQKLSYGSDLGLLDGRQYKKLKSAVVLNDKQIHEHNKNSHGPFKVTSPVKSADVSFDDRPLMKLNSAEPVGTSMQNLGSDTAGGKTKAPLSSAPAVDRKLKRLIKDSNGANASLSKKKIIGVKINKLPYDKSHVTPPKQISKKDTRVYGRVVEVTRRPDTDSSKWFTGLPWKDRMKAAEEEETLVLLKNLDPTYTSSEVEDIVWHSFREDCTAKVLPCAAICSPHSGQAFVIFKTKQVAGRVVQQLEEGCLMLPNRRPLLGHVGVAHLPGKSSSFPGHLFIDRLKFSMQKDKREAVSTSHSSQPNTLEYDMAMEWRALQERSEFMQKNLLKRQGEELKKLGGNLKRKVLASA